MRFRKKILAALAIVLAVLLAGCGLMEEAAVEIVRETYGDEYADAYEAEYDAAMEQLDEEWAEVESAMEEEMDAAKEEMKEAWDDQKEQLLDEAHSAIEEEYGESGEVLISITDWMAAMVDAWMNPQPEWQYPVVDPTCSWNNGFEEATWSWSEPEFSDGRARNYHLGLDLESTSGNMDILAAADGKVVYASTSSDINDGNGYHVILEHELDGETIYSFYAHLATYTDLPAVNTEVAAGERIGTMGSTGFSFGDHLHFAVMGDYCKSPDGRANYFTGDKTVWKNITFYNPKYIIENGKLPE